MKSIKKRLLIGLISVIILSTVIGIAITYFALKEEMDELFDENMKQVAHAIAVHDITEKSAFINSGDDIQRALKGEEEFLIQVWHNDTINFSSKPAIEFPKQKVGGVVTILNNNEDWRYYALDAGDGWLVQVSQPILMRHTVIWEIYSEQLIPLLVQLPVLVIFIWLVVGFGFAPLSRISESIEKRTPEFLEKLPEEHIPLEVLTMVQAINGLLGRLSLALDTQRRFTADAAHELRTPLTALHLELDVLKRSDTEAERQQSLEKLYTAIDRSAHLVQQLLNMARLEPEQTSEKLEQVSLLSLAKKITVEMEQLAKRKNITLDIEGSMATTITGRPHALEVLIGNLISNAIHYTPEGGRVELKAHKTNDKTILYVSDNGRGIPEPERARIFDRFYRILDKNNSGVTGSGLGLSIVKSVADSHKAAILISDGLEGKGVTFQIIFQKTEA